MSKDELPEPWGQQVKMFVCGPTVYDYAHLGHARTYLAVDMMVRYLRFRGYRPFVVMNITDIDERIIERSEQSGQDTKEIATRYEKAFLEDINALGIETIDRFERASDHIPDILGQIQQLVSSGYAYETETGVYFDVSKAPSYGKLSGQTKSDLRLRRFELCSTKRHAEDFSLWRKFTEGPLWDSPWGNGRPGWHIEDTAISMKYLGSSYDIHVGGAELVFPHHEAEIAQGEALCGKRPFVKYWVHMGMLNAGRVKMSKSLGNVVRIRDALSTYSPQELRLLFAKTHYRRLASFSKSALLQTKRELEFIQATLQQLESSSSRVSAGKQEVKLLKEVSRLECAFTAAMDDDFGTPRALKLLYNFLQRLRIQLRTRKEIDSETSKAAVGRIRRLGTVIGIDQI